MLTLERNNSPKPGNSLWGGDIGTGSKDRDMRQGNNSKKKKYCKSILIY